MDFEDVIKLRILRWDYTELSMCKNTRTHINGRQETRVSSRRLIRARGQSHVVMNQRMPTASTSGRGKTYILPWSLQKEGTSPADSLTLSL